MGNHVSMSPQNNTENHYPVVESTRSMSKLIRLICGASNMSSRHFFFHFFSFPGINLICNLCREFTFQIEVLLLKF